MNRVTCFQSVFCNTLLDLRSTSNNLNAPQDIRIAVLLISAQNPVVYSGSPIKLVAISSEKYIAGIALPPKNNTGNTLAA